MQIHLSDIKSAYKTQLKQVVFNTSLQVKQFESQI